MKTNFTLTVKVSMFLKATKKFRFKYQNMNPFKILKTSCAHTKRNDLI